MAATGDNADKEVREITECPICMSTFTDPIMLSCIHIFCFGCLKSTGEAQKKKPGDKMPCPLCRKDFIIPPEGIVGLQKNFCPENFLEFKTTLQSNLSTLGVRSETNEDMKEEVKRMSNAKYCNKHNQEPLDYYCAECKIVVCVSCFVETHKLHDCKDVATVEENVRQAIKRAAWKTSNFADEMLTLRKNSEKMRKDFLRKLEKIEMTIIRRNRYLKDMIDRHTDLLLDELTVMKSRNLREIENQLEEINRCCTILRSFQSYCTEITLKGSASDVCSSVDQLIARAAELGESHEAFVSRSHQSVEVYLQGTHFADILQNVNGNLIGNVAEVKTQPEFLAVVVTNANEVVNVNLQRWNNISSVEQIPTKIAFHAVTAVYCNTMYVVGVGDNSDEIWKYNISSSWVKCASLVQGRRWHRAAFIDEILYICGGSDPYGKHMTGIEAYNEVAGKCTIVGKLVHGVMILSNCVPVKSSLYMFGDASDRKFHHVQVYNTKDNKCSVLSRPIPRPCCVMRAVLWDTSVILLGMDNGFIFNTETETWQRRKRFKTGRLCHGLVLDNETVFAIVDGPYGNEVHSIPVQKIITNKPIEWKVHAKFPDRPEVHNCVKMRFLSSRHRAY